MSSKYKAYDHQLPHLVTSTVVGWVDVFTRELYCETIIKSLFYCTENKGLILNAWVIMSNHIHLIVKAQAGYNIGAIMRDFKKHTSKQIVSSIQRNEHESRKGWLLNMFAFNGTNNNSNKEFQFWQQDYHPITLDSDEKLRDRFAYLHNNPVRAGVVWEPQHYKYSSATDYYENKQGLLPITKLIF